MGQLVVCSDTVKMRFLCVGVFFCLTAAAYALPQEPIVEPQGEVTLQETSPVHPPELEDVEAISSREAGEGRKDMEDKKDKKKGGKKEKKEKKKRGNNKRN